MHRRCVGITVATQQARPIRRCAQTAVEGFNLCARCNKRPMRQAIFSAILKPDWEQATERILAGEEPEPVRTREALPTPTQTEAVRDELRWWEHP